MLTTIDRSAETATKTIYIPVAISSGEPGTYSHNILDVTAKGPKGSTWIVTWILEPSDGLSVTFRDKPIDLKLIPKGVHSHHVATISSTECQLTFTNNVSDVNAIRYDLLLDVHDAMTHPLVRSKRLTIDPTISVVKDPIDG